MFVSKREHDNGAISSSTLSCARPGAGTTELGHRREKMTSPACWGCLWEQAAGVSGRQSHRWSREPELTFTERTQLDASSHRLPHAQPSQDPTGWTPLGPRAMPQQGRQVSADLAGLVLRVRQSRQRPAQGSAVRRKHACPGLDRAPGPAPWETSIVHSHPLRLGFPVLEGGVGADDLQASPSTDNRTCSMRRKNQNFLSL